MNAGGDEFLLAARQSVGRVLAGSGERIPHQQRNMAMRLSVMELGRFMGLGLPRRSKCATPAQAESGPRSAGGTAKTEQSRH